jgi:hypothetical protein
MSSRLSQVIGHIFAGFAIASTASAYPTSLRANISLESQSSIGIPQDTLSLFAPDFFGGVEVLPGTSVLVAPLNSAYAAPMTISMDVSTVGNQRTVTIRYASTSSISLLYPAAADALPAAPPGGFYAVGFRVGFSDSQWDGSLVTRTAFAIDDGVVIRMGTSQSTNSVFPSAAGFRGSSNPALPNFDGFGSGVMDAFEFRTAYRIVPSPGGFLMSGAIGALVVRRRRAICAVGN